MKPEPWWPISKPVPNIMECPGKQCALFLTNGIVVYLAASTAKPGTFYIADEPGVYHHALRAHDELELRCILLQLAYPEEKEEG